MCFTITIMLMNKLLVLLIYHYAKHIQHIWRKHEAKCEEKSAGLYQKMYIKADQNFLKRNYHIKKDT